MAVQLRAALRETLDGWQADVAPAWRGVIDDLELAFGDVEPALEIESWEPIFPARRGAVFPGAPAGAHMLRAFDRIAPQHVRCVILGQDPYPCPAFATGRAFEAGNVARWRELDKMFSPSVRAFIQAIVARAQRRRPLRPEFWGLAGDARHHRNPARWTWRRPKHWPIRWVASGVLLLNSSLTLSRFQRAVDPHQSHGHLPLWRPLMIRVIEHLAERGTPVVFLCFGDAAAETLAAAGLGGSDAATAERVILRPHPAEADAFLALENPFALCNRRLQAMGAPAVDW